MELALICKMFWESSCGKFSTCEVKLINFLFDIVVKS